MGTLHILHDSAPVDQSGPAAYLAQLRKLALPDLFAEFRHFVTRWRQYRDLAAISEEDRMGMYQRLNLYLHNGSDEAIWRHLWTPRNETNAQFLRGGFQQWIYDQRGFRRVLAFAPVKRT